MKIYLYENQIGKILPPAIVPYENETPKYVVDAPNLIQVLSKLQSEGKDLTNLDLSQRSRFSQDTSIASAWRSLNGASLKNMNLSKCNFSYNTISDMDMSGVNFSHSIMDNTTIINSFGNNINFYGVTGNHVKFCNSIFIEPDFRHAILPETEWQKSKWCLQKDQIGSIFDKTLQTKQNAYGVDGHCDGLKMSIKSSLDSVIPGFVKLTSYHKENKFINNIKNSNEGMKISLTLATPTLSSIGFLHADIVKSCLSKLSSLSSQVMDGGFLSSVTHLISTNPFLSMGVGLGTAMSLSFNQNKKNNETQIANLSEKAYSQLQLKYKKLPNMPGSFFSKFNHLIFSSNRILTKSISDSLKKVTPQHEASCLIAEYKTGQVIFCNKKNLDLAMNEIMDKLRDNSITYNKAATFIVAGTSNDSKSITFSPDGTTIVVSMNQKNEPVSTDVFDKDGKCIQSIDNEKNITIPTSSKQLNDMLQNIVVNMEYMKKAEQALKINYNPLTHFMEKEGNVIKIIDRKTMMVDNPYDYSVVKILPNQQVECMSTNQGNIMNKTLCLLSDMINRNMPDKKIKNTIESIRENKNTFNSSKMYGMA